MTVTLRNTKMPITREQLHAKGFRPDGKGGLVRLPAAEFDARHGRAYVSPDPKDRPRIRGPKKRIPNATEQRWLNSNLLRDPRLVFRYEAISFRLASGALFTPDWTGWDGAKLVQAIEVKGAHSFHSHGRAALAFKTAAHEWPAVKFIWARWDGSAWQEDVINQVTQ